MMLVHGLQQAFGDVHVLTSLDLINDWNKQWVIHVWHPVSDAACDHGLDKLFSSFCSHVWKHMSSYDFPHKHAGLFICRFFQYKRHPQAQGLAQPVHVLAGDRHFLLEAKRYQVNLACDFIYQARAQATVARKLRFERWDQGLDGQAFQGLVILDLVPEEPSKGLLLPTSARLAVHTAQGKILRGSSIRPRARARMSHDFQTPA
jgi:hypothetical protein